MQLRTSKALALLGGVATLALGSTFMLRLTPKPKALNAPCSPKMLELERAVCVPIATEGARDQLAELALHAPN
jgi:hypothetical protein